MEKQKLINEENEKLQEEQKQKRFEEHERSEEKVSSLTSLKF